MSTMLYAEEDDDGEIPQTSVLPVEGHQAFHHTHVYKILKAQRSAGQRRDEEARRARPAERAEKVEKGPTIQEAMEKTNKRNAKSKKIPFIIHYTNLPHDAFLENQYRISGPPGAFWKSKGKVPIGQWVENRKHTFILFEIESVYLGEGYVTAYRNGRSEYVPYTVLWKEDKALVINLRRTHGSVCFETIHHVQPLMETLAIYDLPPFGFTTSPIRGLPANEPLTALQNISIYSRHCRTTALSFCRLDRKPFTYRFIESVFEFFSQDGNQFVENFTKLANCDEFCWLDTLISTDGGKFFGYDGRVLSVWEGLRKCRELRVLSVKEMKYWHKPNPLGAWPFLKEFIGRLKSSLVRRWDFSSAQYLEKIDVEVNQTSVYFNNPLLKDVKLSINSTCCNFMVEFGDKCQALRSLEMKNGIGKLTSRKTPSVYLSFPSELPNLRTMKLTNITVGEEFAKCLANCNSLEELSLDGPSASYKSLIFPRVMLMLINMTILSCESVVFPEEAPNLRKIDISHAKMDTLNITGDFPALTCLQIHDCDFLTSIALSIKCGEQCRIRADDCSSLQTMDLTVQYTGKEPGIHAYDCKNLKVVRKNLQRVAFNPNDRNKMAQPYAANGKKQVEEEEEEEVKSDGSDF